MREAAEPVEPVAQEPLEPPTPFAAEERGMTEHRAAALTIHSLFGAEADAAWDEIRDVVGPEVTDALIVAFGQR